MGLDQDPSNRSHEFFQLFLPNRKRRRHINEIPERPDPDAAVDELQAVVARFNEQLRIFKAKQKAS